MGVGRTQKKGFLKTNFLPRGFTEGLKAVQHNFCFLEASAKRIMSSAKKR
jgi:hypothetical protein